VFTYSSHAEALTEATVMLCMRHAHREGVEGDESSYSDTSEGS
jgi:hypothetical protein